MKINVINNITPAPINKGTQKNSESKEQGYSLSLYVNSHTEQVKVRIIDNKSNVTVSETNLQELRDIQGQIYDIAGKLLNKKI